MVRVLAVFSFLGEIRKQAVENGEDEAERHRPPKAVDAEVVYEIVYQQNQKGVDHQQEKTQGDQSDGYGQDNEHWPDKKVGKRDKGRNEERGPVIGYMNSRQEVSREHDRYTRQEKTNEQVHQKKNYVNIPNCREQFIATVTFYAGWL